jgi:hypothetical protein
MKKKILILAALVLLALATLSCSVCEGVTGPTGGGDGNLTMINNSGETVCFVYISPVEDDTWGDDWLGSTETVSSGSQRRFDVPNGDYDLRATDCGGNELDVEWGVNISGDYTWRVP